MNSGSAKCYGTKSKKSKKDGGLTPARSYSGLGEMASGAASETSIPSSLPSTSTMALSLQSASAGSFPKVKLTLLKTSAPPSDSKGMDQEEVQREHCGEKHSIRVLNKRRMAASAAVTSEVEPIELDRHVEEIVDLTCDSSIVDLTHNDSVVCTEESRQWQNQELRSQPLSDSCILCSDEDDNSEYRLCDIVAASKLPEELGKERFGISAASGTVSCPICMDGYAEIVSSGRLIVSTKCGHIFCSQCLHNSLRSASSCPTCRKKLSRKEYHPIYI